MRYRLLIVSLTTLAIVASCSPAEDETINKSTLSEQEIILQHQISWLDVLKQEDNNYIVFVYSEKCGYCHDMMNEVIDYVVDNITATYFVDSLKNNIPRTDINEIGMTTVEEIEIIGIPTIIEVYEGRVIANVPGIDQCLSFLNEKRMNKS